MPQLSIKLLIFKAFLFVGAFLRDSRAHGPSDTGPCDDMDASRVLVNLTAVDDLQLCNFRTELLKHPNTIYIKPSFCQHFSVVSCDFMFQQDCQTHHFWNKLLVPQILNLFRRSMCLLSPKSVDGASLAFQSIDNVHCLKGLSHDGDCLFRASVP